MDTDKIIIQSQKEIIGEYGLKNWFDDYPWLSGYIGDIKSEVWFLGENPSLSQLERQSQSQYKCDKNSQWNTTKGDKLLRESITEARLKDGEPCQNKGWKCYITNVIKEPEFVKKRNAQKKAEREEQAEKQAEKQAEIWLSVLQKQIDLGSPKIFITLGESANDLFKRMIKRGLNIHQKDYKIHQVYHYSYIMDRPEPGGKRRKKANCKRIEEYKKSIADIVQMALI